MTIQPLLEQWLTAKVVDLCEREAPQSRAGHLLMGCPVWGDGYIERFTALTARSLLAGPNLAALRGRCRMDLFTDAAGFPSLWQFAKSMGRHGLDVRVHVLPEPIMAEAAADKDNKFWILGTVQQFLIQTAGWLGMGFHAIHADLLYPSRYFPNLLRLGEKHHAIAHATISANVAGVRGEATRWALPDGSLTIPTDELGAMAWRHLHPQTAANLMNRGTEELDLPTSHCCIWQGYDRLHVYSCHMNAAWMSPRLCFNAPVKLFNAIDCALPYFMPLSFYVPTVEDGVMFIELSDDSKPGYDKRVSPELHAAICWSHTAFRDDFLPFFARGSEIQIGQQPSWLTGAHIARRQAEIHEGMVGFKETVRGRIRRAA